MKDLQSLEELEAWIDSILPEYRTHKRLQKPDVVLARVLGKIANIKDKCYREQRQFGNLPIKGEG
jgi:hypothetical protein